MEAIGTTQDCEDGVAWKPVKNCAKTEPWDPADKDA